MQWLLPVVFGAVFFKFWFGAEHLIPQAAITLELLMMGIVVPETCWSGTKICNKDLCCISLAFYFHILMWKYFIFKNYIPFNGIEHTRFDLRLSQRWTCIWLPSAPRSPIWLSFRFSHRNLLRICLLSHACHMPVHLIIFDFMWGCRPAWAMTSFFLDHTLRSTTVGITPLDEWSARYRDLYLTAHNNRHTSMPPGGIRIHRLSQCATADLHLRLHSH